MLSILFIVACQQFCSELLHLDNNVFVFIYLKNIGDNDVKDVRNRIETKFIAYIFGTALILCFGAARMPQNRPL